jgi:glycosyltransferase involved in cell wall biosynthesis
LNPSGEPVTLKVLIVSSYRTSCGVASYTEVLKTLLETDFDVSIAALDQTILKRTEPHVVATGDQLIRDICDSFKYYDVVNLQWEPGLLGGRPSDKTKRFAWIIEAAKNLILTVHTALAYPKSRGPFDFLRFVRRRGPLRLHQFFFAERFERGTYKVLHKRVLAGGNFVVATHTERERQFFKKVVGVHEVFDHPLSHLRAGWYDRLAHDGPLARRELQKLFPSKRTFIGVFGFLSEYKGIMTALKAMKHLDDDYHLFIYGGVHPETIKRCEPIDPYVSKLMKELEQDANHARPPVKSDDPNLKPVTYSNRLLEKVTFFGAPDDDYDFALAVSAVDLCLFPYLEVGQSGSGPASHAIELGKPTILTRTKAFIELEKYFPKQFEMVDVGNYIQLAQTIRRLAQTSVVKPKLRYNSQTLAEFYGDLIRRAARQPIDIARDHERAREDKTEEFALRAAE